MCLLSKELLQRTAAGGSREVQAGALLKKKQKRVRSHSARCFVGSHIITPAHQSTLEEKIF
jgi:hypothetical protein